MFHVFSITAVNVLCFTKCELLFCFAVDDDKQTVCSEGDANFQMMKIIGCDLHQLRQDENEVDEFVVASHYFE
jgi:hypothetical protein